MSDQWRRGAVISLEQVFRSKEFGRRPARWDASVVTTVEAAKPPLLEEVFLSDLFGHPEAIGVPAPPRVAPMSPSPTRPALVLLKGHEETERNLTRYRGALGAVSGVAAAALVVAGMSGTGSRSERPTVSAEGKHPSHGSVPGGGGPLPGPSGVPTQPTASGPTTGQPPAVTGGAAAPAPAAQLVSAAAPATPATVGATPSPAPVGVVPTPPTPPAPAPGGGTPPSGTSPGGGGSVLTPVLATAGNTISTVGSTVTAASSDLAQAVPAASRVTGLLANVGATVTNLGRSVAGT